MPGYQNSILYKEGDGETYLLRPVSIDNRISLEKISGTLYPNADPAQYTYSHEKSLKYNGAAFAWGDSTAVADTVPPENGLDSPYSITLNNDHSILFVVDSNRLRAFSMPDGSLQYTASHPAGKTIQEIAFAGSVIALLKEDGTEKYSVLPYTDTLTAGTETAIETTQTESQRAVESVSGLRSLGNTFYFVQKLSENYTGENPVWFLESRTSANVFRSGIYLYEFQGMEILPATVYSNLETSRLCITGRQRHYSRNPFSLLENLSRP